MTIQQLRLRIPGNNREISAPMPQSSIALTLSDGRLSVAWSDGLQATFHPIWLRERLPDGTTLDPGTGQRLIEAADLPLELAVTAAEAEGESLTLTFSDGQRGTLPLTLLRRSAAPPPAQDRVLWGADLAPLPAADFAAVQASDAALCDLLQKLHRYGFAVVRGLPVELDGALRLTDRIGPIRITNWGGLADVKAIAEPYDLTMTPRRLEQHSDNPYRRPVPGYVFLHCLRNDAVGGESVIVDGFQVAERLRAEAPEAFAVLTRVQPRFRYEDDSALLESEGPLIELDPRGRVRQVRYSNRTELVEALPPEELDLYYRARQLYYRLLNDPACTLVFKLEPGELMIMDNYRLLHGRRGYRLETGSRHMRQCYMDRDILNSRRLVLLRTQEAA